MQRVSKTYKQSMKSPLRERAFIMLSFGLVNQEAQVKATVESGEFTSYSNREIFRERKDNITYATLEENFTKADGSMYFLPREAAGGYYNTGLISKNLLVEAGFELFINLNMIATDFKGLTVQFGANYPVDFDVIASTGQTIAVRGNTMAEWVTEEVIKNTTSVRFVFYKMKYPHNRVRIYIIKFGYGLVYSNDSVLDSSLDSYVSPIGADIPQIDFFVQLKNYDHYFDIDNPNSAINYLETGQEMDIMYGYQLPGSDEVEWIQGGHLLCSAWESDDGTATISCQDIFRNMDSEYRKGLYSEGGKDYYTLAQEILKDARVKKYYIDPRLKTLYSHNPIPRVTHKEALQLIANACKCVLSQSRSGEIQIKSNFIPDVTITTNGETHYSKAGNIQKDTVKAEYASLAQDYTNANGKMFFLPRGSSADLETGYVSNEISNDNGLFTNNPVVTFAMDGVRNYHGIKLIFGNSLPKKFIVRGYNEGTLTNEFPVDSDEISQTMVVLREFDDCNQITIEFTETAIPHNRITINHFSLSDVANFTMERGDMTSSPKAMKQELIKEVIVPCYIYQKSNKEENLVYEDTEVVAGKIETFYIQDPSYGYFVKLNEQTELADVIDWGNYYVTVQYKVSGQYKLEIQGYRYRIVEKHAVKVLGQRGKTVKWKNPIISNMVMAQELADWLAEYYTAGIEYEYDTRGNPEIDVNDVVYQENQFHPNMKVNIYRHSIKFKQSFSGNVVARRIGG